MENLIKDITKSKQIIGIGTGKTVSKLLKYLDTSKLYVPSSIRTMLSVSSNLNINTTDKNINNQAQNNTDKDANTKNNAQRINLSTTSVQCVSKLDLYIDGCDYFDRHGNMIKGKGAALTTEKLMCSMADEILIVAQDYKFRETFDNCFVPIEIIPQSLSFIISVLIEKNIKYTLRLENERPVITDLGNLIFDIQYNKEFIDECKHICGIVEHGYFDGEDFNLTFDQII